MSHEPALRDSGRRPGLGPTPQAAATTGTFDGIFLRPNLGTQNAAIPASGPYNDCPDIWISGLTPLPNFQTELATAKSYGNQSVNTIVENATNFIYIRGFNSTAGTLTRTVQLYFTPASAIPWPGMWQNNVILTDQNATSGLISDLGPSSVGVADATFQWVNVPPPQIGDHYCLIAQLNDPENPSLNPFPGVSSQIDLSAMITNNLGWGWINTTDVPSTATFSYTMGVTVPENTPAGTRAYFIFVEALLPPNAPAGAQGFIGYSVSFVLSEPDAEGNVIQLLPQTIQQNGFVIGVKAILEPGYSATATVTLQSNGNTATPGATMPLQIAYDTGQSELERALSLGLVDARATMLARAGAFGSISPTALIPLGGYTGRAATPTGVDQPARRGR